MSSKPFEPLGSGIPALEAHISKLNNYHWVRDSGKMFFISKRERVDRSIEHCVDRHQ